MNPFESGERKCIPAVLVYVRSGDRILMLHRNAPGPKADGLPDYHSGKWNGLGGKLERDESPLEAAVREVTEESGLRLPAEWFRPLGVLQFPNFKAHKHEDWLCTVIEVRVPDSERKRIETQALRGPEGDLHWVPVSDLGELNLWAGDRHFLPYVERGEPFLGTIWYRGEVVERVWLASMAPAQAL